MSCVCENVIRTTIVDFFYGPEKTYLILEGEQTLVIFDKTIVVVCHRIRGVEEHQIALSHLRYTFFEVLG